MSCQSRVTLSISRVLGKVVVMLDGPVDAGSTGCLRPLIADLVEGQGNLDVEIDLRRASVDAAGIGLLAETAYESRRRGGVMVVRGAPPGVREVLEDRGLADTDDSQEPEGWNPGRSTSR